MFFNVEPSRSEPIYKQLVEQIRRAVASGRLDHGEQLPGSRTLAEDLQINLHTVNKAYQELVREGVLEQKRGVGTFVAEDPSIESKEHILDELRSELEEICREADAYDVKKDELQQLLDEIWSNLE